MPESPREESQQELERERWEIVDQLDDWLETPMVVLGFVWLALLVLELTRGLSPMLSALGTTIWILFIFDFAVRLLLAPRRWAYLRSNWLTAVALVLPAFRALRAVRVVRALRAARGLRLVRIVTSLNRGMRALGRSMRRRGFGYVLTLTALVTAAGAAGMYAFENLPGGRGLHSYPEALWWTAMVMTTMGSEYWPQTAEGRVLALFLALYAFAVFGYVTAALATFFVGRDAESAEGEVAGEAALLALRDEITRLREEVRALSPPEPPR